MRCCCFFNFIPLKTTEKFGGENGGKVFVVGTRQENRVQILDEAVCISHNANTLWKGMNPDILSLAMGK